MKNGYGMKNGSGRPYLGMSYDRQAGKYKRIERDLHIRVDNGIEHMVEGDHTMVPLCLNSHNCYEDFETMVKLGQPWIYIIKSGKHVGMLSSDKEVGI